MPPAKRPRHGSNPRRGLTGHRRPGHDRHRNQHTRLAGEVERLRELVLDRGEALTRLTAELGNSKARIAALERDTPQARQAQYEADPAAADLAESGFGEPW